MLTFLYGFSLSLTVYNLLSIAEYVFKSWFGGWRTRRIDAAVIAGDAETSKYIHDVVVIRMSGC